MNLRTANKIAKNAGIRPIGIGLILKSGRRLSGWKHCYFGKKCNVYSQTGQIVTGRIVCDPKQGSTIIQLENGTVQRGGRYQTID